MNVCSKAVVAALAVVLWLGAQTLGQAARDQRANWPRSEDYVYLLPSPEAAPVVWAGYRELFADVYWAFALVYYGSSLVGEADFRYLERFIDNVLALDGKFKRVYQWASYAVMFQDEQATQDEHRLSVKYLERGIKAFPDDYEFFWAAGIRYFLDLHSDDPAERRRFRERGAELIEQAMRKPNAPTALATFAASLRMKLGQKQRALHDLREMILLTEDREAQEVLIQRYNRLSRQQFPAEAQRAKDDFRRRWQRELPFASPSMYILLGDRPDAVIDFEALATDRDLFGAEAGVAGELPDSSRLPSP